MIHGREDYNKRIQDSEGLIPADEPVFLIRAQDQVGADVVDHWVDRHLEEGGDEDIAEVAKEVACKMRAWPNKKAADL